MSVPVELHALRARMAEYGPVAFVVTADAEGAAHVVSAELRLDGERLVVPLGRTSRRNLEGNPKLTLLWPVGPDPAYSMLVDATLVSLSDEPSEATVEPRSAVLHRVAGASGTGPNCVPVADT
jgi:hypothetical protein